MRVRTKEDNSIEHFLYENQRWQANAKAPVWSDKLQASDRKSWCDMAGVPQTRDSIGLPSLSWQWPYDWKICTENGDSDGWEYAADFNAAFSPRLLLLNSLLSLVLFF